MKFNSLLLVSIFSLIFIIGCTQSGTPPADTNATSLEFAGDRALVDYILVVNLTNYTSGVTGPRVYDTSIEEVARANGIYNSQRQYGPILVTMNSSNGLLPAFTRALVGMKEEENKTFYLSSDAAYGPYNSSRSYWIAKRYVASRYEQVPVDYFTLRNITYTNGTKLMDLLWGAEVVNYTNESVLIKYFPEENQTFVFRGFPETVISSNDENMTIELALQVDQVYQAQSASGATKRVYVLSMNDTSILLDENTPLAGKTLQFTVFVKKIEKA